jgi:hypothetical protein
VPRFKPWTLGTYWILILPSSECLNCMILYGIAWLLILCTFKFDKIRSGLCIFTFIALAKADIKNCFRWAFMVGKCHIFELKNKRRKNIWCYRSSSSLLLKY